MPAPRLFISAVVAAIIIPWSIAPITSPETPVKMKSDYAATYSSDARQPSAGLCAGRGPLSEFSTSTICNSFALIFTRLHFAGCRADTDILCRNVV